MIKQKTRKLFAINKLALVVLAGFTISLATLSYGKVKADQYDDQVRALQAQNSGLQVQSNSLAAQADSYQSAIDQLQTQINALQQNIVATQNKSDEVKQQIADAQAQLDQEKKTLGESIKAMYIEGDISTFEILASSKNISEYVDKQEYRNAVQNKIKTTVDKITALKIELDKQQRELDGLLKDLQTQQNQLYASEQQQSSLLSYTEGQKAAYDTQIKANNSQISTIRAQQLAANRRAVSSGSVSIISSGSCGGGYPADAVSPYGHWGCNYAQDNVIDSWGMFNRECVSYTAYKVWSTYGYMPNWGGVGNADQWPSDAVNYRIPTGSTPKVGSVAIGTNPYYFGPVGHAMWVEAVYGDGSILVSQYNFSSPGNYSTMRINASLIDTFIYFGG
jgi:surface antigen